MTKNKTNYEISYENRKNEIVVNIFPDIKEEEFIPLPNKNTNNNNDAFNFLINIFIFIESNIYSLHKYLINYLPSFNRIFYKIQNIFLIFTLLSTFVYSLEDNSNITTNLIVSAYFQTSTHITYANYDGIVKTYNKTQQIKPKKAITSYISNKNTDNNKYITKQYSKSNITFKNNAFNNRVIDCETIYISDDLKSIMSSSANAKNTYVNYEKNCKKIINNEEFYFFFIIPIKSCFFSFLSLIFLYFFIKVTYTSRIRSSFLFNILCLCVIYILTNDFYKNEHYLASTFMYILQIYILKCLIDSVYILLNYKKNDFEIFSTNLTAINLRQFWLKFIILSIIIIISGFMSSFIYKLSLNYIIFYLCLLTYVVFLCNCLEPFSPEYLKPMKNLLMFAIGLLNFAVSKWYFSNNINQIFYINSDDMILVEKEEEDIIIYESSLYLISDLFSLFCFDYLREYIKSHFEDNFPFHKKLTKLDFIIIAFFISSFSIGILGVMKSEYISFILAIYIAKISLEFFIKIFNTKISRLISHLMIVFYIFSHLKISSEKDSFLINFFSFTKISSKLLSNLFQKISLFFLILFGRKIYSLLYYSNENMTNDDLKELPEEQINKILEFTSNISKHKLKNLKIKIIHDNNKYKMINIFLISIDLCLNYLEICILFIVLNERHNNFIMKLLYIALIILFISTKFFVINEIKNNIEYLSCFFIAFIFSLRLLVLSGSYLTVLHYICHFNLLLLIIGYSINDKKNKFISVILVLCLIFELPNLNSFFLPIDLITLIFFPIIKEYLLKKYINITKGISTIKNREINKKCNSSLILVIFLLILFSLQLYGISNYNIISKHFKLNININITNAKNKNNNLNKKKDGPTIIPIEYYIIYEIISFLKIKK